ncbi:MAG: M23 family metallopeptidase [Bacteroidota bacterium]
MSLNLYNRLREKLEKKYRVELIDDITLSSSRQFSLKPLTLLLWSGLLILGIVIGTATVVILTPAFHRLMPNTITMEAHEDKIASWQSRYDSVSEDYKKLNIYLSTFRYTLGVEGDSVTLTDEANIDSILEANPSLLQESGTKPAQAPVSEIPDAPIKANPTEGEIIPVVDFQEKEEKPIIPAVKLKKQPVLLNLHPPITGNLRGSFGNLRNPYNESLHHFGVDIIAEENTPIKSVADGYVLIAEYSDKNGWVIGIQSDDQVLAFYKHNSRLLKNQGEYVLAGEPIAIIGNTGENSTGPHLHLELWQDGKPLNPSDYINFNK